MWMLALGDWERNRLELSFPMAQLYCLLTTRMLSRCQSQKKGIVDFTNNMLDIGRRPQPTITSLGHACPSPKCNFDHCFLVPLWCVLHWMPWNASQTYQWTIIVCAMIHCNRSFICRRCGRGSKQSKEGEFDWVTCLLKHNTSVLTNTNCESPTYWSFSLLKLKLKMLEKGP